MHLEYDRGDIPCLSHREDAVLPVLREIVTDPFPQRLHDRMLHQAAVPGQRAGPPRIVMETFPELTYIRLVEAVDVELNHPNNLIVVGGRGRRDGLHRWVIAHLQGLPQSSSLGRGRLVTVGAESGPAGAAGVGG